MIKIALKNYRLLLISICSGAIYLFMEFSERVNSTITILAESNSSKGLGVLIVLHIVKYAAIIFCVLALIIFLKVVFIKDKELNL